jgi:PleD family two-component response regulator
VTMSFGVSASASDSVFDYQTVCAEADAALYEAKRSGRNAVCSHLPGSPLDAALGVSS